MSTITLTPEQRHIVGHSGKSILIEAVAGSGKTTTLAACVTYRERQGTDPRDILVLVFTPAAEQVFRQRLAQAGASRNVRISTYSAFARSLLDAWRERGVIDGAEHYFATPEAVRSRVFEAIEQAAQDDHADPDYSYDLTNLHAEIVINQLSLLKGTLAVQRFAEESDAELADTLDIPRGLISICRHHERLRHIDQGVYAFQCEHDLVADALSVVSQMGEHLPRPHFSLIVADEWHDANAAHVELLRMLATEQTRIIAAGDREQVVHAWNGADPRYMGEAYAARFPGTQWLPLTNSFRCGPTLSAGATALIGHSFVSARSSDTTVEVERYDTALPEHCANRVVETLQSLTAQKQDGTLSDCAVLLRDRHQSIALENALIQGGVPYATEGFVSYFNRTEVLMLRGILHIIQGSIAPVSQAGDINAILRALGLFAGLQLAEKDWTDAEKTIAQDPETIRYFYDAWLKEVRDFQEKRDLAVARWRQQFAVVCDYLIAEARQWPAGRVLAYAAERLNLADTTRRLFVVKQQARAVSLSIDGFIAYATQTGLDTVDFLKALEAAQVKSGSLKKRKDRLTLATAREAKGKEWKHVLLPYLVNGEFPDPRAEPGEERRLFYVAITRASHRLFLFIPQGHQHLFTNGLKLAEAKRSRTREEPQGAPIAPRIYLKVPFAEKDAAKQLGARWDNIERQWWIPSHIATGPFAKWLPRREDGDAGVPPLRRGSGPA